jgi:hypothetical protein
MVDSNLRTQELQAHEGAIRTSFETAAKAARDLLTPRLVAYVTGVHETRTVNEWAHGLREARSQAVEDRLRFALQVALLLSEHDDRRVVQAWFQGLNPHLDDQSPARLLREGDLGEVGPQVMAAARAFVVGG